LFFPPFELLISWFHYYFNLCRTLTAAKFHLFVMKLILPIVYNLDVLVVR